MLSLHSGLPQNNVLKVLREVTVSFGSSMKMTTKCYMYVQSSGERMLEAQREGGNIEQFFWYQEIYLTILRARCQHLH